MQEMKVIFLTSYEVTMSCIFGIVTAVLTTKFMNAFVLSMKVEEFIKRKHRSGCLISASLIFCVLYLIRGSIEHSTLALQSLAVSHAEMNLKLVGVALAYFFVFYVLSFIFGLVLIFMLTKVYRKVMKEIDFDFEIEKNDNFGLSLFLSIMALGLTLFVDKPFFHFLGSLVFHQFLEKF